MDKYAVTRFESVTIYEFENGDVINISNETGRCYMFNKDTEDHRPVPAIEVLLRIARAELIK